MEAKPFTKAIQTIKELGQDVPKLFGIPTGVPGLDDLFFTVEIKDGKAIKRSLGGVPYLSVVNITGVSDTGKSLMAEQFAINQAANGYKVLFVTVESPAPFVVSGMKTRAKVMGFEWQEIENNIVMIDAAKHSSLRDDLNTLLKTMEYAIDQYDTKSVVIDSVTGLFEAKEMVARSVVRKIFNFLKTKHQTGILISQKRSSHEELSAEAAGGYAVSHIVDCSIVVSKQLIMSKTLMQMYHAPYGSVVRLLRIDGCRLCGHDTKTHLLEITPEGLVVVKESLDELMRGEKDD